MRSLQRLSERPLLLDSLFALLTTIAVMVGSAVAGREQPDMRALDGLAWAFLAVAGLSLSLRRRWPWLCVAVTFGLTMTYVYLKFPYGPVFLYSMIAVYTAAAWRSTVYSLTIGAVTILSHLPWSWWMEPEPDNLSFSLFTGAVWLVSPIAVGIAVRARREADARAHAEERRRHVSEERLRMAQEVHDTVGHSLAIISLNAGAALHVLAKTESHPRLEKRLEERLEESLRAIRSVSGSALDELRAVLSARPFKGLASLPDLVAATNVNGLRVSLSTVGDPRPVPDPLDLAAYRIVQESLANVVRHAHAEQADVTVSFGPDQLTLRIVDDGVGGTPGPGGTGLASMRARTTKLSGTLSAGPALTPGGGFEVRAVLPYESVVGAR